MNVNFEDALSANASEPNDLVSWQTVLDAFSDKVSTTRTINGKSLDVDITLDLASADFANQGTTIKVLHGNASGNPSWGSVVGNDISTNTININRLLNGTAGNLITWGASGVATVVTTGNAGQVLTSAGAGLPPLFSAIPNPTTLVTTNFSVLQESGN